MRSFRIFLWCLLAAALAVLAAAAAWQWWEERQPPVAQQTGRATISGDFSLVDHTGKRVTDEDFRGQWLLAFFGFTHCPDVCPTTLNWIAQVMNELGSAADRVQPLFFTVDPERDTPKAIAEYVSVFHPRIVGLTGTLEQVREAAESYRTHFSKVEQENTPDGYTMAHAGFVYLMTPEGKFERLFSHDDTPEDVAAQITNRIQARSG